MSSVERPSCLILGGGGHAKVVVDALQAADMTARLAVLDANPALEGTSILGVLVLGGDGMIPQARQEGYSHFVLGLGGAGGNAPRRTLFEHAITAGLEPLSVVHPAAAVSPHADLGLGTVVLAGAVINAGARIGRNVIVNTGALVEHDCRIGDHAHIAPGGCVLGGSEIGGLGFIGAGAVIKQGLHVGTEAMVGAGAVVLQDVAAGARVAGVPAVPLDGGTR